MEQSIKEIGKKEYETGRLRFRMLTLEDAQDVFEYGSRGETCKFLKWGPYADIGQAEAFLTERMEASRHPTDILFGIELKKERKIIGAIRIYNITGESADISYIQSLRFCGNGYMVETVKRVVSLCFEELGLMAVQAYFAEGNVLSERVMVSSGMERDESFEAYDVIKGKKFRLFRYRVERKRGA